MNGVNVNSANTASINQCNKTRVVHLVYGFHVGGLERIIADCIVNMPRELQHTVVCLSDASDSFVKSINEMMYDTIDNRSSPKIDVVELHKPPGNSLIMHLKIFRLLRQLRPKVLHSYNLSTIEYQLVGMCARVPIRIHAEHGRDLSDPDGTNKKYIMWRRLFSRFLHKHICVSDDLYQWLTNHVGISKQRALLIRNGVDTSVYAPKKITDKAHSKAGASSDSSPKYKAPFVFGHVARLDGIKNQTNLITAFISACNTSVNFNKACRLVIVGTGPMEAILLELAKSVDNIEMWGQRHDMPEVYHAFNVFTLSSDAEGIPMTMLEAMSSGLPILSTAVGGIPEVVTDDNGMLVSANNVEALKQGFLDMFQAKNQHLLMSCQARKHIIESFSQTVMHQQYLNIYQGHH